MGSLSGGGASLEASDEVCPLAPKGDRVRCQTENIITVYSTEPQRVQINTGQTKAPSSGEISPRAATADPLLPPFSARPEPVPAATIIEFLCNWPVGGSSGRDGRWGLTCSGRSPSANLVLSRRVRRDPRLAGKRASGLMGKQDKHYRGG